MGVLLLFSGGPATHTGTAALTGTGSLEASGTADAGTVTSPVGGGRIVWVPALGPPRRGGRLVTAEAHLTGYGWLTADGTRRLGKLSREKEIALLLAVLN